MVKAKAKAKADVYVPTHVRILQTCPHGRYGDVLRIEETGLSEDQLAHYLATGVMELYCVSVLTAKETSKTRQAPTEPTPPQVEMPPLGVAAKASGVVTPPQE